MWFPRDDPVALRVPSTNTIIRKGAAVTRTRLKITIPALAMVFLNMACGTEEGKDTASEDTAGTQDTSIDDADTDTDADADTDTDADADADTDTDTDADTDTVVEYYGPENTWPHAELDAVPTDLAGTGYQVGDIAYNFVLEDQFGDEVELYQFYGSVIVIDAFAMW